MGFLSKLFGKQEEQVHELVLNSYMKGKVVDITEVPDPVFAQRWWEMGLLLFLKKGN